MRRWFNALLGLGVGLCTWPVASVIWPGFCAWYLWHETDDVP